MNGDESDPRGERSSGGPGPRYVRRPEEAPRRSGGRPQYDGQMDQSRSRTARAAAAERRRAERRTARRLRRIAAAVFFVAALVIAVVGLEVRDSEFGAGGEGRPTPFSLLPLDTGRFTSTTISTTTSTTSTSLPTSTTTSGAATSVGIAGR